MHNLFRGGIHVHMIAAGSPFISAYAESDFFGRLIFLSLFILSGISWAVLLHKGWVLFQVRKFSREFISVFSEKDPLSLQFKGQVLSLVPYIAKTKGYSCEFKGVTPLSGAGDKYAEYGAEDYLAIITEVFRHFQVPFDRSQNLIHGFSTNENTIETIKKNKYNLLYIDGSHDYEDVVSDINLMHDILDVGGYLVMDDASSSLAMPLMRFGRKSFNGHPDVAKAIDDFLIKDRRYKHLFACGHNRVFRRESL